MPRCSECKAEIVEALHDPIPGADWICLDCSGASLSDFDGGEGWCRECGERYEVNLRLNDGYCDDCRVELNQFYERD
jgi:hypothetical protein